MALLELICKFFFNFQCFVFDGWENSIKIKQKIRHMFKIISLFLNPQNIIDNQIFRFFLLSGYLMASLYIYKNNISKFLTNFYYRRIKRILPIYLFMIAVNVIILSKNISREEYKFVDEDSKWAMTLLTNYQDSLKNLGYFETVSFCEI